MGVREALAVAFVNGEDARLAALAAPGLEPLRDASRAVFAAHVEGRATTRELAPLNRLIEQHLALRYLLVAAQGRVGSARMSSGTDDATLVLSEIALAIVELFGGSSAARVKRCAREGCDRFFLDESKSATRTWCSMQTCGNRMKAARYYERRKVS